MVTPRSERPGGVDASFRTAMQSSLVVAREAARAAGRVVKLPAR